jgi:hypothetical protein
MSMNGSHRIYLLAVCFVSIVCMTITSGIAVYSFVKVLAPELTLDTYSYSAHLSLDNFRRSHFYATGAQPQAFIVPGALGGARPMLRSEAMRQYQPETAGKALSNEEIERLRQESYQSLIANHKRGALQELIRLSIVLLVSGILFFVHWRLLKL